MTNRTVDEVIESWKRHADHPLAYADMKAIVDEIEKLRTISGVLNSGVIKFRAERDELRARASFLENELRRSGHRYADGEAAEAATKGEYHG